MKFAFAVVVCSIIAFSSFTSEAQIVVATDIDYINDKDYKDGRDMLDIYMPEGAENVPVIVFFHGGALLFGDKTLGEGIASRVVEGGFGLVSANYRLSPAHAHPAHVEDAAAATAWVLDNIESYGGNPEKVFIARHSAGAYLAALLAVDHSFMKAHDSGGRTVKGTVLISPFLYVEETAPVRINFDPVFKSIWGEGEGGWLRASVTPHIGRGQNDILVIYADGDDPWRQEQNERFVQALTSEGSSNVRAIEVANRDHESLMTAILEPDDQIGELIFEFIRAQ